MQKDLTTGSVFKNVLYFSLPYLLSYFLQTLYGMADLFIIGQFEGTASITAVSIGSQIMHMITVMLVGLAMGVTVGIGRAVGAHDDRGAGAVIGNAVMLFLAVSVAMAAVLTALVQPILSMMSTPAEAVPGAAPYLTICFIGIPCITAYNIIASIFRGLGDSRSPMYFIAVACAANIGLDYLFMGALHMGPAGAALVLRWPRVSALSSRWGSFCGAKAASGCKKVTCGRRKVSLAASCASACRWPCRTDLSKSRFYLSRSLPTGAA